MKKVGIILLFIHCFYIYPLEVYHGFIGNIPYEAHIYDHNLVDKGRIYSEVFKVFSDVPYEKAAFMLSCDGKELVFHQVGKFGDFRKLSKGMHLLMKMTGNIPLFHMYTLGRPLLFDENMNPLQTYDHIAFPDLLDYHTFHVLENGNIIFLINDNRLTVNDKNQEIYVRDMIIRELDIEGNVVFEWNTKDHFDFEDADYDISSQDQNNEIYKAMKNKTASCYDYSHCNDIFMDYDGHILLSTRHLEEITKINHQTGEIIWRWGGKNNQFTFINDPYHGFSFQHSINRLKNGNILLYDNGNLNHPFATRVVEYKLDEKEMTATLVWEYFADNKFTYATGSVQELENGNVLIGWGFDKQDGTVVTEVTRSKEKVLEIFFPKEVNIYKARKYS